MGDIINLNKYRKRKQRAQGDVEADRNRRVHGRSAAERKAEKTQRDRATRDIDGKRLPDDPCPTSDD